MGSYTQGVGGGGSVEQSALERGGSEVVQHLLFRINEFAHMNH